MACREPILKSALLVRTFGSLSPKSISFPDRCPYQWVYPWLGPLWSLHSADFINGAADQCTVEECFSGLYWRIGTGTAGANALSAGPLKAFQFTLLICQFASLPRVDNRSGDLDTYEDVI